VPRRGWTEMKSRRENWRDWKNRETCDVLILGGGVNGTGLLRDLAFQGVDAVLVDKGDFASGASSKSSRMIHGGLRYLENAEFRLVREAVRERDLLLRHAPHYVRPLKTVIPISSLFAGLIKSPLVFLGFPVTPGGRGAFMVKTGLRFYDAFTGKRRMMPRHFFTSRKESLRQTPGLRKDIVCTATYWDARISQAERLCIGMINEALRKHPATMALNYASVSEDGDGCVRIRDSVSGEEARLNPRVVVNATGAWVDKTNRSLGIRSSYMGGTKGSHLVLDHPELLKTLGDRMVYYEHEDGRVCIVFGFEDRVIMGSTDIRVGDPDEAACEEAEIDYMLKTLRGVFPDLSLSREQIVYYFCGVRPLPASGLDYTGRVPRSHLIREDAPAGDRSFPVLSLIGGKWTTFRALAEETTDRLLEFLGRSRVCSTEEIPYAGASGFPREEAERNKWVEDLARETGLPTKRAADLLCRYGTEARELARRTDSSWRTPLEHLPDYTIGEIAHLVETEGVERLSDLVCRRSTIALMGRANPSAMRELSAIVGERLNWDGDRMEREAAMVGKTEYPVGGKA